MGDGLGWFWVDSDTFGTFLTSFWWLKWLVSCTPKWLILSIIEYFMAFFYQNDPELVTNQSVWFVDSKRIDCTIMYTFPIIIWLNKRLKIAKIGHFGSHFELKLSHFCHPNQRDPFVPNDLWDAQNVFSTLGEVWADLGSIQHVLYISEIVWMTKMTQFWPKMWSKMTYFSDFKPFIEPNYDRERIHNCANCTFWINKPYRLIC